MLQGHSDMTGPFDGPMGQLVSSLGYTEKRAETELKLAQAAEHSRVEKDLRKGLEAAYSETRVMLHLVWAAPAVKPLKVFMKKSVFMDFLASTVGDLTVSSGPAICAAVSAALPAQEAGYALPSDDAVIHFSAKLTHSSAVGGVFIPADRKAALPFLCSASLQQEARLPCDTALGGGNSEVNAAIGVLNGALGATSPLVVSRLQAWDASRKTHIAGPGGDARLRQILVPRGDARVALTVLSAGGIAQRIYEVSQAGWDAYNAAKAELETAGAAQKKAETAAERAALAYQAACATYDKESSRQTDAAASVAGLTQQLEGLAEKQAAAVVARLTKAQAKLDAATHALEGAESRRQAALEALQAAEALAQEAADAEAAAEAAWLEQKAKRPLCEKMTVAAGGSKPNNVSQTSGPALQASYLYAVPDNTPAEDELRAAVWALLGGVQVWLPGAVIGAYARAVRLRRQASPRVDSVGTLVHTEKERACPAFIHLVQVVADQLSDLLEAMRLAKRPNKNGSSLWETARAKWAADEKEEADDRLTRDLRGARLSGRALDQVAAQVVSLLSQKLPVEPYSVAYTEVMAQRHRVLIPELLRHVLPVSA